MRRCALAALAALIAAFPAAAARTVSIGGVVTDAAGHPIAGARLRVTSLQSGGTMSAWTGADGKYEVGGGPVGPYLIEIHSSAGACLLKEHSFLGDVDVIPAPISFQIGARPSECGAPPPPEATLAPSRQAAQAALDAKDWQGALAPLKTLIGLDPDDWRPYAQLAEAQWALGHVEDAYGAAGSAEDRLSDSIDPHSSDAARRQERTERAHLMTIEGEALIRLEMIDEGIEMLGLAALLDPDPAAAYGNLCATLYDNRHAEGAAAVCDKAIAADPKRADLSFFKGALLLADAKPDAHGKIAAAPGAAEALRRYLALAPDGAHASDVHAMLHAMGAE